MILTKRKKQDPNENFSLKRRHILGNNSDFQVQEAYKTLRTNIRFLLSGENCRKFCITSGLAGEGKSITILNLAISFAQAGQRVLLIDGDLRRPSLARLLVEVAVPGLSNILAGLCKDEEAIRQTKYPNLDLMPSGEIPPNPSELLGSENMEKLIQRLSKKYDYILVDAPPVGIVADACVIANVLDGTLFVVRQNETEKDAVIMGVRQLELSGSKLLGFILNGAEVDGSSYRYGRRARNKRKYNYESYTNGKR